MRSAPFTHADHNRAVGEAGDTIRAMYEAMNRGDAARSLEYLHSNAELHQNPDLPGADTYIGRDEFVRGDAAVLRGVGGVPV
jgi:ketosteroid isomerase-like protein